jgi:phosphoribosyl 1,2-cyclic phosphodiesterase
MMRMTVLASGSKGNSTLVASSRTRILVDAGLSARELVKRMRMAQESAETIDALLITHEHQDHVQGVAVLARKLGIPVYFTEATHRAWVRWMKPQKRMTYATWLAERRVAKAEPDGGNTSAEKAAWTADEAHSEAPVPTDVFPESVCEGKTECGASAEDFPRAEECPKKADPAALPAVEYFSAGSGFSIGDIAITPFTIPHDAADPVGFVFEAEGIRIGIATDLGYMPPNVSTALRHCDVLMLESNHDLEMLRDGPYPWPVKQRVMSRVGHLSNDAAAQFLKKDYDGYASHVILAHLSEKNNLPELAKVGAERALGGRMSLLANKVVLASQDRPLEPVCL